MNLRIFVFSLFSFALGVAFVATTSPVASSVSNKPSTISHDTRAGDREAIRAHIEKIFRSYIDRDCDSIRTAHALDWIGFAAFSRTILRGRDEYMKGSAGICDDKTPPDPNSPVMVDYKLSDIYFVFYGDVALVPYIADTVYGKTARLPGKLRSLDVYAKVNGSWIQVGSHLDLHPDTVSLQHTMPGQLAPAERKALMSAREAIWRAFFSNDRALLDKVVPNETIAINPGTEHWDDRAGVLASAEEFAKTGGKLVQLEFPKTEVQLYGDVAILYSTYRYVLEVKGATSTQSGRATEVFVRRNSTWVNSGWHLDSGK